MLGLGGVGAAGDALDDQAQQDVVGVGVVPPGSRGELRAVGDGDAYELPWRQGGGARRAGQPTDHAPIAREVEQTAGVGEKLPEGDFPAVVALAAHQPRKVLIDRVVQVEPSPFGQLEDDRRDKGLGDAARAEAVAFVNSPTGAHIGQPGRGEARPVAVQGEHGGPRCPAPGHQPPYGRVQRRLGVPPAGVPDRRGDGRGSRAGVRRGAAAGDRGAQERRQRERRGPRAAPPRPPGGADRHIGSPFVDCSSVSLLLGSS